MLGTSTTYEVLIHEARKVILHCASESYFHSSEGVLERKLHEPRRGRIRHLPKTQAIHISVDARGTKELRLIPAPWNQRRPAVPSVPSAFGVKRPG